MAFVPTNKEELERWLHRFHSVNDALDTTRLHEVYAKDITLQYGNRPPVHGLNNLIAFFEPTYKMLDSMHHKIAYFDLVGDGSRFYQPCHITYRVKNDPEKEAIKIPAIGVWHLETAGEDVGKAKQFEVYLDPSPVTAAVARATGQAI
ncbi:hypothetical protein CMQ_3157 [Grosmannia clavigera kw1407]|uniref:SnoaL-like domain-containing protein n=1 Tax=Grosmannia clavigera (strain kw1407 / UAMH 11150) TaxID=655863 RepID=F0XI74_GROCL|nr:uncharacterized protein CMQ_3157 [Grosmannia clavigera kw1407]EFX03228.1 hypothetical protein CMQ_3157 [Grosmannia clavigera kw1407]